MKKLILLLFSLVTLLNYSYTQVCTPQGDEVTYGTSNVWIGYVYDNMNLTTYSGYVNEGSVASPNFDQSFGGSDVNYATNGCSVFTNTFSVRYKLSKTFSNGCLVLK